MDGGSVVGCPASRRTCELAGAELVETVGLPPGNDMYERGDRVKCRYCLLPRGIGPLSVPPSPRRGTRGEPGEG